MVDFYDNVQSFYEAPTLELLSDPSASDFFGDEFDTQIFPDPQGSSFMDFNMTVAVLITHILEALLLCPHKIKQAQTILISSRITAVILKCFKSVLA